MSDFWSTVTGGRLHTGSWLGLPDFGATEALAQGVSDGNTTDLSKALTTPKATSDPLKETILGTTDIKPTTPKPTTPTKTTTTNDSSGQWNGSFNISQFPNYAGWDPKAAEQDWIAKGKPSPSGSGGGNSVDDLARQQEEAAAKAKEAARLVAQNKYDATVRQTEIAKEGAKGNYDWLIDTYGSNKKDLLDQITLNETDSLDTYKATQEQNVAKYGAAKQEILNTYRDLNTQQEKIMRGTGGMANSSRSQEAQLKLNNLMGKDLSTITTNEADSIAAIGKAVATLKEKNNQTKNSIENTTKQNLDKAALDYNTQIKQIDENVNLAADSREEEYAVAEATLAENTAKINTWAAQTKIDQESQEKLLKAQLDSLILGLTDDKSLLNSTLTDKLSATQTYINSIGYKTQLDSESNLTDTTSGVKQAKKYSKTELDSLLGSGKITQEQYNQQMFSMGATSTSGGTTFPGTKLSSAQIGVNSDPLLKTILGSFA